MMADGPVAARDAALGHARTGGMPRVPDAPAFDAVEFAALNEMIGEDGVREMVEIFETETRQRLRRLAAGDQNAATLVREMHTLKGAAGTVSAPRLAALGRTFEQAAERGIVPPRWITSRRSAMRSKRFWRRRGPGAKRAPRRRERRRNLVM